MPSVRTDADDLVMPLHAEELSVTRRRVTGDTVRVSTATREREQLIDEELTHHRVEIERVVVDRVVDAVPPVREEGDVTIVPVVEERLVIETRLVLAEEIRITRRRQVHNASQTIRLRQEQVIVERRDAGSDQWRAVEVPSSSGSIGAAVADSEPPAAEVPIR